MGVLFLGYFVCRAWNPTWRTSMRPYKFGWRTKIRRRASMRTYKFGWRTTSTVELVCAHINFAEELKPAVELVCVHINLAGALKLAVELVPAHTFSGVSTSTPQANHPSRCSTRPSTIPQPHRLCVAEKPSCDPKSRSYPCCKSV
jgi:hypothetical protein